MRLLVLTLSACVALAHDPVTTKLTWSAEISRIVYLRCGGCHREGGKAPMSLLDYESARPWAKAIRDEVLSRRMPPWGAVKGFGDFAGDPSLTQDEMARIAEWVEGGTPEGDARYLPPSPAEAAAAAVPKGTRLRNVRRLGRAVSVLAIAPLASAESARITARRPDGSVEPLLWLRNYKAEWKRTFVYRSPLRLPVGTVIEGGVPFELVVR